MIQVLHDGLVHHPFKMASSCLISTRTHSLLSSNPRPPLVGIGVEPFQLWTCCKKIKTSIFHQKNKRENPQIHCEDVY